MPKVKNIGKPCAGKPHARFDEGGQGETCSLLYPLSPGRYRHYKGNEYDVIDIARHSETEEELVVYRKRYGDCSLWVRPLEMFLEQVMVEGQSVPRFERLGDS